jgi:uroporphyrin-III C-methyltransferase/precorrin-2 dehydrogenase/sirohydrochlorin ferrochelatase
MHGGADTVVYPLGLRLAGRRVLVVGGGSVAVRRVAGLRAAGADVVVVAPALSATLADLASRELITAHARRYEPADTDGAWLVLACTDQPGVNAAVAADAQARRIWCVRADDALASPAWVPAVGRAAGATVAVSAGRNPRRAAMLRDQCVALIEAVRNAAPGERGETGDRARPGIVSIVGGGPGDPGLITVAGWRRLRQADVVVADRLAPLELLDELPPDVTVIDAAKVPGGPAMDQAHINATLVEHARQGLAVVRLKGGDPFVFGRGREELDACLAAGVPVEVLPGVTSAVAVPAAAGIPVTHRGLSQGFCVVAGHASPGDARSNLDWEALAHTGMTLVMLMAVDHLADTAQALLSGGLSPGTPCACVSDGWSPQQRVVRAPLRDLAKTVQESGVTNPAVVVVGEVAGLLPGPDMPARPGPRPGGSGTAHPGHGAGQPPVDRARAAGPHRVLVLGGARSGKSAAAEGMLDGCGAVDYVATGAPVGSGDAEWDERVRAHRERRPVAWRTLETLTLEDVLAAPGGPPVLVDCLTTWLARVMDECGVWEDRPGGEAALAARIGSLAADWQATRRHVVTVSSEVGAGVVPRTQSGRRFRDELGRLNTLLAAGADEVWYCTAGIPRRLR